MNLPGGWELLIVLLMFLAVTATLGFVVWFAVRQGTRR
jgi:cytoskeletal protein RodZ